MFILTAREYEILLEALAFKYGPGYSDNQTVGHLQAKLSMMMEAVVKAGTSGTSSTPT